MKYVFAVMIFGSVLLGATTFKRAAHPPLGHTFSNPEELAAAVLDAFARKDRAALEGMALTAEEFLRHVWPELPASRPERNLTSSYVWNDLHGKSRAHLATHLGRGLPSGLRLRRVTFDATTQYPSFAVHRDSRLHMIDAQGHEYSVRLFGSVVEKEGRYKIFSFVTD